MILEIDQVNGKLMVNIILNAIFVQNGFTHLFFSILKNWKLFQLKLRHLIIAIKYLLTKGKK